MAGISFIGTVMTEPDFKTVGKKNTPLAELKLSEEVKKKENGKWIVTGHNNYEVKVWGDKAVEASGLKVGDKLDLRSYVEDDYIRHRVAVSERTWEWKGKNYSALELTAFEWEIMNGDDE